MNQRKHDKSSSLSFTANAVFSLLSTVTLSPTSILMLEVLCQSARHGLLHFYSAAVLPVLPTSVTVSCLITNIHPALWLCRFLALHKIKVPMRCFHQLGSVLQKLIIVEHVVHDSRTHKRFGKVVIFMHLMKKLKYHNNTVGSKSLRRHGKSYIVM